MPDSWYYGNAGNKKGPFTGQELKDLASSGKLIATDTVWKEGVAAGALASRVKNLFQAAAAVVVQAATPPEAVVSPRRDYTEALIPLSESDLPVPPTSAVLVDQPAAKAASAPPPAAQQPHVRKGRAIAGKGAVIMSQDGVNVKFTKKCTVCGYQDSSWTTAPIRNGVLRANFYCRKCRKSKEVEVQCSLN